LGDVFPEHPEAQQPESEQPQEKGGRGPSGQPLLGDQFPPEGGDADFRHALDAVRNSRLGQQQIGAQVVVIGTKPPGALVVQDAGADLAGLVMGAPEVVFQFEGGPLLRHGRVRGDGLLVFSIGVGDVAALELGQGTPRVRSRRGRQPSPQEHRQDCGPSSGRFPSGSGVQLLLGFADSVRQGGGFGRAGSEASTVHGVHDAEPIPGGGFGTTVPQRGLVGRAACFALSEVEQSLQVGVHSGPELVERRLAPVRIAEQGLQGLSGSLLPGGSRVRLLPPPPGAHHGEDGQPQGRKGPQAEMEGTAEERLGARAQFGLRPNEPDIPGEDGHVGFAVEAERRPFLGRSFDVQVDGRGRHPLVPGGFPIEIGEVGQGDVVGALRSGNDQIGQGPFSALAAHRRADAVLDFRVEDLQVSRPIDVRRADQPEVALSAEFEGQVDGLVGRQWGRAFREPPDLEVAKGAE